MSIRLTKWTKEQAVRALVKDTFAKRKEKAAKRMTAAAHRAIKKKLGSRYRALTALPAGWAEEIGHLSFNIGGERRHVSFAALRVPARHALFNTFEARDPLGEAVKAAHDEQLKIEEEEKALLTSGMKIAERFHTAESLAKEWPLLAPYLPKENPPVPALPIEEITERFKQAKAA